MLRLTRRLLAIAAAFLTFFSALPAASAQDWFFRPLATGPYGTGDGKSYNNAWHSDRQITWGSGGIQPGDTLYVCGTHDYGLEDQYIAPGISGLSDSQRITIDGNCPRFPGANQAGDFDPGVIFAANSRITDGWTSIGNGIYTREGIISCTGIQVTEDKSRRLIPIQADPDDPDLPGLPFSLWPAGSYYQNMITCSDTNTFYYKPTSGAPFDHVLHTGRGDPVIDMIDVNYIDVTNIDLYNSKSLKGVIRVKNSDHIRIIDNNIRWAAGIAISVIEDSDFGEIRGNKIYDVSNGIYFTVHGTSAGDSDNWLISNNEIYNIDQDCFYCHPDSHAIGFQGSSNVTLEYNHIHHGGGSGITFYTFPMQAQMNNTIRYNLIHDIEDLGDCSRKATVPSGERPCRNERGIEHSSSNRDDPETTRNNAVHHNVLYNIRNIALRTKGTRPASGYSWGFFNNTVYSSGTGIQWNEHSVPDDDLQDNVVRNPSLIARNNIFLDITDEYISQGAYIADKDHTGIEFSNNIYFNRSAENSPGFTWNNQSYSSHSVWMAASAQGAGSSYQNPLLVSPENGDFRIYQNSPANFAGVPVPAGPAGPITTSSPPHIGALESTPVVTTSSTTTTSVATTTTITAPSTSTTVPPDTTQAVTTTTTFAPPTTSTSTSLVATTTTLASPTTTLAVTTTTLSPTTTTIPTATTETQKTTSVPEVTSVSVPEVASIDAGNTNEISSEPEITVNATGTTTVSGQGSGGGGCSAKNRTSIDPTFPIWTLVCCFALLHRRRKKLQHQP